MRNFLPPIVLLSLLLSLACDKEQSAIDEPPANGSTPVEIINSQQRSFYSEVYDREITLQVYLPMSYDESDATFEDYPHLQSETRETYPVLYLLDADVYFGMAAVIVRLLHWEKDLPGMIVVGDVYGLSRWWGERTRDYLPFAHEVVPTAGRSAQYLEMYKNELIPYVESTFRADPEHRIVFGHSGGGTFALYTLLSDPEVFHGYLAASPWGAYIGEFFFPVEEEYSKKRQDLPAKLFTSMGDLEQKAGTPDWERFVTVLKEREYENLTLEKAVFADENHLSSAPLSLTRGLRWYFSQ